MDLDDFRSILRDCDVNIWTFIDTAITVASSDYSQEFKSRRDGIIEKLYAKSLSHCQNCVSDETDRKRIDGEKKEAEEKHRRSGKQPSPASPSLFSDEENLAGDDQQEEQLSEEEQLILIREQLEDPDQSDDALVDLLQGLADTDITFKALKETDVGRHVNSLRKHPSAEVRRFAKHLVRKWKDLVDDWVRSNPQGEGAPSIVADNDSPLQYTPPQQTTAKNIHDGTQVSDHGRYSPNLNHGEFSSDRKNSLELDSRANRKVSAQKEIPHKQSQSASSLSPAPKRKECAIDMQKLASARKRLHENYQEAQNAKKQRTIQVMDLHDIPKPKNTFFARNKGGVQAKHW